jgi:peptidoglycan L-alanyl-D-glutamate endopeptidase CwlK
MSPVTVPATSNAVSDVHTVVSGDTLSGIAKKYKTTVGNIKKWNGLKGDLIKPKQKLKVSKPKPVKAKVSIVTYPGSPLSKGSTGINVKRIQNAMKVKATGTYNAATVKAVAAYQKRKGLEADGITGPATWAMMF